MAYGNKYYLDFYDRFNNQIKVYIQQEDYVGGTTDLTGGDTPLKLHWMGEGSEKYKAIKGSACEFSVISTSDQQFLNLFTTTSREYKVIVYRDSYEIWRGFIDPDSYQEPFLYHPYESVIHASDGLGELKNVEFPTPDTTEYYNLENHLLYYIRECLFATGHELDLWVTNNLNWTGATRMIDDTYLHHKCWRDDNNEFTDCYDILDKILTSIGARLYQWNGVWNIERIDYLRDGSVDINKYTAASNYNVVTTGSGANPNLTMTGVDGSPMCVWVNQSPTLEIVPGLKSYEWNVDPGKVETLLPFTNNKGWFSDSEFQDPGTGSLTPRYWTWEDNYNGYGSYTHSYTHFTGNDFLTIKGVDLPYILASYASPGPDGHAKFVSDTVTLDNYSLREDGSLGFTLNAKVGMRSGANGQAMYKPYFRWGMKLTLTDALFTSPDNTVSWTGTNKEYIAKSVGNTQELYAYEYEGKIYWGTVDPETYTQSDNSTAPYIPGILTAAFQEINGGAIEYAIDIEDLYFNDDYDGTVSYEFYIYPLGTWVHYYSVKPPLVVFTAHNTNYIDIYRLGLTLRDQEFGYTESGTIPVDTDNRRKDSYTIYLNDGIPTYNRKYWSLLVPLKSDSSEVGNVWTVGGTTVGGLDAAQRFEISAQYLRPMRKLSGMLCSDPGSMGFGKVLIDNYSKKYICTGVEYDAKNAFWDGEWREINDPGGARLGDYDADDFSTGDFWAI